MIRECISILNEYKFSQSQSLTDTNIFTKYLENGNVYMIILYDTNSFIGLNVLNDNTSINTNIFWNVEELKKSLNKYFPHFLRKKKIDNLL